MRGINKSKVKEKYDFETIMWILVLALIDNGLYLIDVLSIKVGPMNYNDIALGVYILFGIYILMKYRRHEGTPKYKFKFLCLFTVILVFTSSFTAWRLFGQGIMLGVRPQRFFLISYLMYFLMVKYFYVNKENYYKFEKAVYVTGTMALCLYIIQYMVAGIKLFLYIVPSTRYGEIRLMFSTNVIPLFAFVALNNLLNGKNKKKNSILLLLMIIYFLVVSKTRLLVLGLGVSILAMYILWKKNLVVKLGIMFIALSLIVVLARFPVFNNYISLLNSNVRTTDGNYIVRLRGKTHYKNELKKSPILGRGYPNELYKKSVEACRADKGYFLIDNGLTGFEYIYGILGVAWFFLLFTKMFIYSYKRYKYKNDYAMMGYVIFCACIMSNIVQLYWGWGAVYGGLTLAILENTGERN